MDEPVKKQHGALYWFCFHATQKLRLFFHTHKRKFVISTVLVLLLTIQCRAWIQFLFLDIRRMIFPILLFAALLWFIRREFQRPGRRAKAAVAIGAVTVLLLGFFGPSLYHYLWLYNRYQTLDLHELTELPLTDHERIQAATSMWALAHDAVSENESPAEPDFVRAGAEDHWTLAIEPAYPLGRIFRGIQEIFDIDGRVAAPSFGEHRIPVHFEVGEHLMFSRNAHTATVRTFGFWRYFNYEPAETIFFPDDHGEWVEVVSLIRWRGFFFPRPEFGGVQLFRQEKHSFLSYLKLVFLGAGEWIPPEDIAKYPFLKGQNLLSKRVSEPMADSLRFQGGLFSPLPGYHDGDIRVPELGRDVNPQPFIGYFRDRKSNAGLLYHYFALEPFDVEKQGLNTSLFVPADGGGRVSIFHHFKNGQALSGVSSIATKIMESRKSYDWERNRPVEHRPFIKEIEGKTRFFWLTTVVTSRLGLEEGKFIAGSLPELVITDAETKTPVWVEAKDPGTWVEKLKSELRTSWGITAPAQEVTVKAEAPPPKKTE